MKKIITLVGVIGSGKDYQKQLLLNDNPEAKVLGFSDGVREFTWNIIGWRPKNEEEYEWFKDNLVLDFWGFGFNRTPIQIKGRKLLENVADQMRRYDEEFWGKYWLQQSKKILATSDLLIAPDCRHEEEAKKIFLNEMAGVQVKFIFCNYKSERYEIRDHSSEKFAQKLLEMGCKDGEIITDKVLKILGL